MIQPVDFLLVWRSPRLAAWALVLAGLMLIERLVFLPVALIPYVLPFQPAWCLVPVGIVLLGPAAIVAAVGVEFLAMVLADQPGVVTAWRCLAWLWIGLLTDAAASGSAAGMPPSATRGHRVAELVGVLVPVLATHAALLGFTSVLSRSYPWAVPATFHLLFSGGMSLVLLPWLAISVLPRWQARHHAWWQEIRASGRPEPAPRHAPMGPLIPGTGLAAWAIGTLIGWWGYGVTAFSHHALGSRAGWGVWIPVAMGLAIQAAGYARWRARCRRAARGTSEYGRFGVSLLSR